MVKHRCKTNTLFSLDLSDRSPAKKVIYKYKQISESMSSNIKLPKYNYKPDTRIIMFWNK